MLKGIPLVALLTIAVVSTARAAAAPAQPPPPTPPAAPHTMQWSFEIGQGRLGAQVSSMTPELRLFFGAPNDAGILVQKVEKDSVAAKANVAVGDVLLEVDGERVTSVGDVRTALADRQRGDVVDLVVIRKQKRRTLAARLEDDPGPTAPGLPPGFGFGFGPGSGFDLDLRGFGLSPDLNDRLQELEKRLDALDGGGAWATPKPKRKAAPKSKPVPRRGA